MVDTTLKGVVARVELASGVGIIRRDNGVEYSFRRSALKGAAFESLKVGQVVTFLESENCGRVARAWRVEPATRS